jgi:hypothetical protein
MGITKMHSRVTSSTVRALRTSTAIGGLIALSTLAMPAAAQNQTISSTGSPGANGSASSPNGSRGGDGASDVFIIQSDVRSVGAAPAFGSSTTGGRGGDGLSTRGSAVGDGGDGGNGGDVPTIFEGTAQGGSTNAVRLASTGGLGGNGGTSGGNFDFAGAAGRGGAGGRITFNMDAGGIVASSTTATAILSTSVGGRGGDAGESASFGNDAGRQGGDAGAGGSIVTELTGSVSSNSIGIMSLSDGGDGGTGGRSSSSVGSSVGGAGGLGGAGGDVTILGNSLNVGIAGTTQGDGILQAGIVGISRGGVGGFGGQSTGGLGPRGGGSGGAGAGGGKVTIAIVDGTISTTGAAVGVLGQSIGADGGAATNANSIVKANGGGGGDAGRGGDVAISTTRGGIDTFDADADGIVGQSIAGSGTFGGSANGTLGTIGGNGGSGGIGGQVSLYNGALTGGVLQPGSRITTRGDRSTGMLAQSIGGNGGRGGDAITAGGTVAYAIGGGGGSGGTSSLALVSSSETVATFGDFSNGLVAQSVGGGGGIGGSAVSVSVSSQINVSVAVGGGGGIGGLGGAAQAFNDDLVLVSGAGSYGLIAQSIGGGGGIGGSARATSVQAPGSEELPTVAATVSVGGSGGTAGNGGQVDAGNSGVVLTGGDGGTGILAQSIGGGGGAGGSSDALTVAVIPSNLNATVAVGGAGGQGGTSGSVAVGNSGLVMTLGQDAVGIMAQAISGGGGSGGAASTHTTAISDDDLDAGATLSANVAVGGSGAGNVFEIAGDVSVLNTGGVLTAGDLSTGILAQSIGGGGGRGGSASAVGTNGETLNANVGVGGSGGIGANGGAVDVNSSGAILTGGSHADGIFAQSVGGGGGSGGKAAVGTGFALQVELLAYVASQAGIGDDVIETGLDGYDLVDRGRDAYGQIGALREKLAGHDKVAAQNGVQPEEGGEGEQEEGVNINVGTAIAGGAGRGGIGGSVTVENYGEIETKGPRSRAIFAQSIGGGGGSGGAATSGNEDATVSASIALGGGSGVAGSGGTVSVLNTGGLLTLGDESHGAFAQSIGGGGGEAGLAVASSLSFTGLSLAVGGQQGEVPGAGGSVSISNDGRVETRGDGSIGLFAQSIGGGGGSFSVMESKAGKAAEDGSEDEEASNALQAAIVSVTPESFALARLSIAGGGLSGSNGGIVAIDLGATPGSTASITTEGRNAYGVLAQSIGGGGVFATGVELEDANLFEGNHIGDGGRVAVTMHAGSSISTTGEGAVGILAQSIGGGGGLVGGMSEIDLTRSVTGLARFENLGDGGSIDVDLNGASIRTTGFRAHGIVAQSAGGGGGFFSVRGAETGAPVGLVLAGADAAFGPSGPLVNCSSDSCRTTIDLENSTVAVTGREAIGVYASSLGNDQANGMIFAQTQVTVGAGSTVSSTNGTGIMLVGRNNFLYNFGTISSGVGAGLSAERTQPIAISATGVTIYNGGSIVGDIVATEGRGVIVNNEGSIVANRIDAQTLTNSGSLSVAHGPSFLGNATGTLLISGDLVSTGNISLMVIPTEFRPGETMPPVVTDSIVVGGRATLSGTLTVNAVDRSYDVTVLQSSGVDATGLRVVGGDNGYLSVRAVADRGVLRLVSSSGIGAASAVLSPNQAAVGGAIQRTFDSGAASVGGVGFGTVGRALRPETLSASLRGLSGDVLGAVAAARSGSSRNLFSGIVDCPQAGIEPSADGGCLWARGIHLWGSRDDEAGITGYRTRTNGIQFGLQRPLVDDWMMGITAAYQDSRFVDDDGPTRIDGKDVTIGALVKYEPGRLQFAIGATGGAGRYLSARNPGLPGIEGVATARSSVQFATLHGRVARTFDVGLLYARPKVDFDVGVVHADAYHEYGAPLALAFDAETRTVGTLLPQLEVGARIGVGSWELRPSVLAGAVVQTGNGWSTDARFAEGSGPSFRTTTTLPDVMAHVAAGMSLVGSGRFDLSARYDADLAKDYRSQAATIRVSYRL